MVRLVRLMTGSKATAENWSRNLRPGGRTVITVDNPEGYLRTTVVNLAATTGAGRPSSDSSPARHHPHLRAESTRCGGRLPSPFSQRAVLALRFYEDLSENEIARPSLPSGDGQVPSPPRLANLRKGIR